MAIGEPMAHCPSCQTEVTEDFGLITCSGCGASLFVDMEGGVISQADSEQVQHANYNEEFQEEHLEDQLSTDPSTDEEQFMEEVGTMMEIEPEPGGLIEEPHEEEVFASPAPQFGTDEAVEESIVGEMNFGAEEAPEEPMEAPLEEWDEAAEEAEAPPVYQVAPTSSDMSDVVDFANSDVSQARDGVLRYNLRVTGIDTTDLRISVKEALTDKRFIWDIEAMIRGIQDGELLLEQISAVKAFIVVSRLAHLPIKISWTQQALSQP